jgi:hypothetical protein
LAEGGAHLAVTTRRRSLACAFGLTTAARFHAAPPFPQLAQLSPLGRIGTIRTAVTVGIFGKFVIAGPDGFR